MKAFKTKYRYTYHPISCQACTNWSLSHTYKQYVISGLTILPNSWRKHIQGMSVDRYHAIRTLYNKNIGIARSYDVEYKRYSDRTWFYPYIWYLLCTWQTWFTTTVHEYVIMIVLNDYQPLFGSIFMYSRIYTSFT